MGKSQEKLRLQAVFAFLKITTIHGQSQTCFNRRDKLSYCFETCAVLLDFEYVGI